MNFKALGEAIGLEEDEYRELVELLLDTGRADCERLKRACSTGDAQEVARNAHTIKGAAGNLGIMTIHDVAKQIELAAAGNRLDAVSGNVETLDSLFDEIGERIRA